jgi:leader peptidase (prepilin peptidase)/N-methyltransferase
MTTADRVYTPIDDRTGDDVRPDTGSTQRDALAAVSRAWRSSGWLWRISAIGIGAAALLATGRELVPLASGVTVAALVPAALVDRHEHRLPDRIVALAAAAFVVFAVASGWSERPIDTGAVVLGMAVFAVPMLGLHLVSPPAMGFGDVKTAVVLGAALGAVHWQLSLVAIALAAGLTATVGIATRARTIAFGPGLIGAAALALLAATTLVPDTSAPIDVTQHPGIHETLPTTGGRER